MSERCMQKSNGLNKAIKLVPFMYDYFSGLYVLSLSEWSPSEMRMQTQSLQICCSMVSIRSKNASGSNVANAQCKY